MERDQPDGTMEVGGPASTAPAAGERRAIGGYQPQYRVAAEIMLRRLRDGSLQWVRFADPEAGRVDDLQVATPGRLDAFQVKWARFAGTLTFREVVTASADAPSLIAQLADGWQRLSTANRGRRVVVHLVTNDRPSTHDALPNAEVPGQPAHFAAFLAQYWSPRTSDSADARSKVPDRWHSAWDTLVRASGLGEAEFERFAQDCCLDFMHALPDDVQLAVGLRGSPLVAAREVAAWREDLDALNGALFRIVAEPRGRVEISRDEILAELGWRERVEFRSRHEFPDPTIPYREITETASDLDRALAQHRGGYLILLGTPGSGKSTLLTRMLRYRAERAVRYYAYVPDSPEPNARRGESVNFLHDLVLALDRRGFPAGDALARPDLNLLSSRLHEQLRQLGEDYQATGRKTVLVVDGLDHIAREQLPSRALLADLPTPGELPDGVYFVLGSQTDHLPGLPHEVADQIHQPERRVQMRGLSREAVVAVVAEADLHPAPDADETERIAALSDGHPLALAYIINRLRGSKGTPVAEVLADIEPFHDRIDVQYVAQWRQIEGDRSMVRLLAKLARVRGPIDLEWVEAWADADALYRLQHRFGHYFRREPDGRWHFFHNSFRVFLLQRTRTLPGVSSSRGDAALFHELAEHCVAAPEDHPVRWDELFYRSEAGDHDGVLAAANAEAFRRQFFAGRPAQLIEADALRALPAAEARGDVVALARLVLSAAEFAQRGDNLGDVPVAELLLALGQARAAVDHVRDGNQLRVTPETALEACVAFEAAGMPGEAEQIFSLAEPLEVLTHSAPVNEHQARETANLLESWVRAAPRFRPLPQVLAAIDRLRTEADRVLHASAEEATLELRGRLRFRLAGALRSLGRWDDATQVVSGWDPSNERDWGWWFWSHVNGWREALARGEMGWARRWFAAAYTVAAEMELDDAERVALAEGLLRLEANAEAARAMLDGVPQPEPVGSVGATSRQDFEPYAQRFVLNRVLGALGDERSLDEIVPAPQDPEHEPVATFERLVTVVARLHGKAWAGERLSGGSFAMDARPILRFASRRPAAAGFAYYVSGDARAELHRLLIHAARLHGAEAVEALRAAYDSEWNDPELGMRWSPDTVRAVVIELAAIGADGDWVSAWLKRQEPSAFEAGDAWDWLQSATKQIRSYVAIGNVEAARSVYRALLGATLAVGQKDEQFLSWVEWAERANAADSERAAERLAHLAGCMPAIQGTEGAQRVVARVVQAAFRWHPAAGFALLSWSYEHGLLRFVDGLEAALHELLNGPAPDLDAIGAVYRNFLLTLDTSPGPRLARALADGLAGRTGAADSLSRLADAVRTRAMPASRAALLDEIDAAAATSSVADWSRVAPLRVERRDDASASELTYFDGAPQTEEGIRALATSLEAVRDLAARERRDSYFRWDRVLPELVGRLSRSEVLALAELFAGHARRPAIHTLLGRRLAELGERERGWQLVEGALAESRPYAWREWYGGERLGALKALAAIDGTRARALAFRTLVGDLTTRQVRVTDIAFELHPIAPLLAESEPVTKIWEHVAVYTGALVAHAGRTAPPTLPEPVEGPDDAVVRFAAAYLDHPALALAHAAQRTFVELLLARHPGALRVAAEHLCDPSRLHEPLLVAMVAVAEVAPDAVAPLADVAAPLLDADRQSVRAWTREVLTLVGAGRMPSGRRPRPLPTVYQLAFEERGVLHRLHEPESTELLPPTSDPAELVEPFRAELNLIARLAHVQPEAVYHRVAQLAGPVGTPEYSEAERDLRRLLDELDLKLTFRRPRGLAVRLAVFRALAELADAGRITPADLAQLDRLMRDSDPSTLRLRPVQRPSYVMPIEERGSSEYVCDGWTDAADAAACALGTGADGRVVIAEETHLRWLDSATATEVRWGAMVPGLVSEGELRRSDDPLKELCVYWSQVPLSEYLSYPTDAEAPSVLQYGYRFDTPVNRWLAFNPELARELGWRSSDEGFFNWIDEAGSVMVESIWWEDGYYGHRQFRDEVGWGWVVRASAGGWKAVREFYGSALACARVDRTAHKQQDHRALAIRPAP